MPPLVHVIVITELTGSGLRSIHREVSWNIASGRLQAGSADLHLVGRVGGVRDGHLRRAGGRDFDIHRAVKLWVIYGEAECDTQAVTAKYRKYGRVTWSTAAQPVFGKYRKKIQITASRKAIFWAQETKRKKKTTRWIGTLLREVRRRSEISK